MSFVDAMKLSAGRRILMREMRSDKRQPEVMNYASAQQIGILYEGDDEAEHKRVKNFVKYLKEEEGIRKIKALAYFSGKHLPSYLEAKLSFDFFTKKDVNWHLRPGGVTVKNFVDERYDILIDLSSSKALPLRFILVESQARFKVGRHSDANQPFYDFMINTGETYNPDLFIEQANHYLKLINNRHGSED